MEWILEYLLEAKQTWSHTQKTIPWYLKGLYFKISDEHTHIVYFGVPPPLPLTINIPGMLIQTYLIEFILWENYFNWLIQHSLMFTAW